MTMKTNEEEYYKNWEKCVKKFYNAIKKSYVGNKN